jgi:hypothetical protein
MLQINTGKLFANGVGRTNQLRGVLYTNLKLYWRDDVVTGAGTLRTTGGRKGSLALVYELEEQMEQGENGRPGVLLSHTEAPYIQDFSAVVSFALIAIVSPDPELAAQLTDGKPGLSSYHPPAKFIRRCFDPEIHMTDSDATELVEFCNQLLGLERRVFLGAMSAIKTYVTALHRIKDDLALAYTLMVSAIESLAQEFDGYSSTWQDVDQRKREPIDAALNATNPDSAQQVRDAILSVEHLSLGRRYREFVISHVDNGYFRTGDALIGHPLAQCELVEVLRQAYLLRSKYVHQLHDLPQELTLPYDYSEVAYLNRQPALTFQGLSRLTRHVIKAFVRSGNKVDREVYDYSLERAGVVLMPLSAQCWLADPLTSPSESRRRLEGFLGQLTSILLREAGAAFTDIRPVLAEIERLLPNASKADRPAMCALHIFFNIFAPESVRTPDYMTQHDRFRDSLLAPSGEALMVLCCAVDPSNHWDLETHCTAHDEYFKKRSRTSGFRAPRLFEAAVSLVLAERFRLEGSAPEAKRLLVLAVSNYPGHEALLRFEEAFTGEQALDWRSILLPAPEAPAKAETTE